MDFTDMDLYGDKMNYKQYEDLVSHIESKIMEHSIQVEYWRAIKEECENAKKHLVKDEINTKM